MLGPVGYKRCHNYLILFRERESSCREQENSEHSWVPIKLYSQAVGLQATFCQLLLEARKQSSKI